MNFSKNPLLVGLFKEPIIGSLKFKMAEIAILKIDMTSFFSAEGDSIWIKFRETGAELYVECDDVVEIETKCRIPIWRTFGRIQWHVIPEPPVTLQGAATWRIQCHDSRVTCHIAGCCYRGNSTACYPRATYHIEGCCHFVNSRSRFQSHMPPGEINVMILPHCRV